MPKRECLRALTVCVLAQGGFAEWSLQLVVEIAGQVLQPHGRVPGEHVLALVQLLLQSCYVQLPGTQAPLDDESGVWGNATEVGSRGQNDKGGNAVPNSQEMRRLGLLMGRPQTWRPFKGKGRAEEKGKVSSMGQSTPRYVSLVPSLVFRGLQGFCLINQRLSINELFPFLHRGGGASYPSAILPPRDSPHSTGPSAVPSNPPPPHWKLTAFRASSKLRNLPCFVFGLVTGAAFLAGFLFPGFLGSTAGGGTCSLFCLFMSFSKPRSYRVLVVWIGAGQ